MLFKKNKKSSPDIIREKFVDFPNLEQDIDKFGKEELYELGYSVLFEAAFILRSVLDPSHDKHNSYSFWVRRIADCMHNLPIYLKEKNLRGLKAEIVMALNVLYNLENIEGNYLLRANYQLPYIYKSIYKKH